MIEQLRKKLTVFLSSVITMILATMSILLFYAVCNLTEYLTKRTF